MLARLAIDLCKPATSGPDAIHFRLPHANVGGFGGQIRGTPCLITGKFGIRGRVAPGITPLGLPRIRICGSCETKLRMYLL